MKTNRKEPIIYTGTETSLPKIVKKKATKVRPAYFIVQHKNALTSIPSTINEENTVSIDCKNGSTKLYLDNRQFDFTSKTNQKIEFASPTGDEFSINTLDTGIEFELKTTSSELRNGISLGLADNNREIVEGDNELAIFEENAEVLALKDFRVILENGNIVNSQVSFAKTETGRMNIFVSIDDIGLGDVDVNIIFKTETGNSNLISSFSALNSSSQVVQPNVDKTYKIGRYVDQSSYTKSNYNRLIVVINTQAAITEYVSANERALSFVLRLYHLEPVISQYAKKRSGLKITVENQPSIRYIPTTEGELLIDLSDEIKRRIANNYLSNFKVIIESYEPLLYGTRSGSQSGISNINTANDYVNICGPNYIGVNKRPSIIISYNDLGKTEKTTPVLNFDNGRSGVAKLNIFSAEYTHDHFDTRLDSGNLSVELRHLYSSLFAATATGTDNKLGMGFGWKTNLHQWLRKSPYSVQNKELEVIYIDGNGVEHSIFEKWYYEDNGEKHYVNRDEVFIDTDGQLKYALGNGKKYSATYEAKSKDGLSLVTSAGLFGYKNKIKYKDIERIYSSDYQTNISHNNGTLTIHTYASNETNNKNFDEPTLKWLNDGGLVLQTVELKRYFDQKITKYLQEKQLPVYKHLVSQDLALMLDGDNYIVKYGKQLNKFSFWNAYLNSTDPERTEYFEIKSNFEPIAISMKKNIQFDTTLLDYYESEDIQRLKTEIKQMDSAIEDIKRSAKDTSDNIQNYLDSLEETRRSQARLYVSVDQQRDLIGYDSSQLELYNSAIQKQPSEWTPEELKAVGIVKSFRAAGYSYQGNIDQLENNIESTESNITLLKRNLTLTLAKLDEYEFTRETQQEKLDSLIKQQKLLPTDFIINDNGGILGFDYYGRLVLISDRYENSIKIRFKEDLDLIEEVQCKSGVAKFNYNNKNLLKSIVDLSGKKTSFDYTPNGFLREIQYDDLNRLPTTFAYSNGMLKTIKDASELTLDFTCAYGIAKVRQTTKKQVISDKKEQNYPEDGFKVVKDLELNKSGLTSVLINNQNNSSSRYTFDEKGRPLTNKNDIGGNISYSYATYNKNGDGLISATLDKRRIIRTVIENSVPTGEGDEIIFTDEVPVGNEINRGQLLNTDTILFELEFEKISNQPSFYFSMRIEMIFTNEHTECKNYSFITEPGLCLIPLFIDKNKVSSIKILSYETNLRIVTFAIGSGNASIKTYDIDGNLVTAQEGLTKTTYLGYENKRPTRVETTNKFNEHKHQVFAFNSSGLTTYTEDQDGNCVENFYSDKGELLEEVSYNRNEATAKQIKKYKYDEHGNVTEVNGILPSEDGIIKNSKNIFYSNSNLLNCTVEPNGLVTTYGFNFFNGELLSKSAEVDGVANTTRYSYRYGFLTGLSHQEFDIHYVLDGIGRKTSIDVACNNIMKIDYDDDFIVNGYVGSKVITQYYNNETLDNEIITISDIHGKTQSISYSNGVVIDYAYDDFDRITAISGTTDTYNYVYDNRGNIINSTVSYDDFGQIKNLFKYNIKDLLQEDLTKVLDAEDAECYLYKTKFVYDNFNRVIQAHNYYGEDVAESDEKLTNDYDYLNRNTKSRLFIKKSDTPYEKEQFIGDEYLYLKSGDQTTNLVKKHFNSVLNVSRDVTNYNYDEMGNIVRIKTRDNDVTYSYDKLSRLVRENNRKLGTSVIFDYDESGNIVVSEKYQYTKGELENLISSNIYSYNQGNYQDQLTSFNGQSIIYDGLGRPTTYRNHSLTWSSNMTLTQYDDYSYQYNEQGIRIKKVIGNTTHKYYVVGTKILAEELINGNDKKLIKYKYFGDRLYGLNYENIDYYYVRNTQGDIISIITKNGDEVARYTYDAWGNHEVISTSPSNIGSINPFRYRGYYYDSETKLYYLNTRYYDPEVGRFISQDNISYLVSDEINGLNLYAYCDNNPVMNIDPNGTSWWSDFWGGVKDFFDNPITQAVIGGLIIVGLGIATILTLGAAAPITGLAASMVVGAFWGAVASATFGAISGGIQFSDGKIGWSWSGAANGFMWGAITGGIAGAAGAWLGNISFMKAAVENGSKFARAINFGFQVISNSALSASVTTIQGLITNNFSWTDVAFSAAFGALGGALGNWLSGTKWEKGIRGFMIGFGLTGLESVTAFLYYLYGDKE